MGNIRPRGLAECLKILWRRKTLIVFVAAVVMLAAGTVVINIPKFFESRALIVVSGAIYDRQANGAQIAMVTEQITSRSNLETLIGRYGLYAPVSKIDPTVQQFQKEIKFDTKYRSDSAGFPESFTVSYRHPDPAIAQHVVADLVSVFDQANKTLEAQAAEEAHRIKAEIANLEARLGTASARRIASAVQSTAASRAASAFERQRAERTAIASTLETLRDRQFALDAQIADQKRLISQQQEVVRNSPPSVDDPRGGNSYGALVKRKAEIEGQIQDYSSKFTDKYPKLVQAREQLAEINQRIAAAGTGDQTRAAAASPASQELRSLQRELSRMETELEVVKREISRKQQAAPGIASSSPAPAPYTRMPLTPIVDPGAAGGYGDYGAEGLRERYTALLRREDALLQFQPSTAGPATPFFQMVDAPNLPQSPAGPIRSKLMLMAFALALICGVAAAAIVEIRRLSMIYDERDVGYFLGVPVVALIPETLTGTELVNHKRQLFVRRLGYLAIGAAAVPILALLLNATKVFQILGNK